MSQIAYYKYSYFFLYTVFLYAKKGENFHDGSGCERPTKCVYLNVEAQGIASLHSTVAIHMEMR